MSKTVAIVVTYNRKKLLEENINALLNQKDATLDILIVDNASTDGTEEMVKSFTDSRIIYKNTGSNLGGAGGFAYGVKLACEMEFDYGWIMDDDSIPKENALYELIKFADSNTFSFLASTVYWTDGKIFPMNRPSAIPPDDDTLPIVKANNAYSINACSFVGCFVNLAIAKKVGLPISEFFIYGDDLEYTMRLHKEKPAYWILNSEIVHKAPSNVGADVVTVSVDRLQRFFFQTRNGGYIARKQNTKAAKFDYYKRIVKRIGGIIKRSPNHKIKRICLVIKGFLAGMRFNPEIQFPDER